MGLRQVRPDRSAPPRADGNHWPGSADEQPDEPLPPRAAASVIDGAASATAGTILHRLRARIANRGDSEHEQILVRCVIAVLIVAALTGFALVAPPRQVGVLLLIAGGYLLGALALLCHLLWEPRALPVRRYVGMLLDMSALTLVLWNGGGTAPIFYPFYLWITLGMGFRYGRSYLFVATALSLLSFGLIITQPTYWSEDSTYWSEHSTLAAGLWLALLLLPLYASTLLAKLTDALARAEEASVAKSRFLATMSHELRTPLHAIIGMADMLQATRLSDEQQDMIGIVRSAGRTLLDMISDVLDITRIEFGNAEGKTTEFDLHSLVATVRALLHHQAAGKGLALRVEIDPVVPYRLLGAALPLQQILINLVANGIKFTHQGSVTIRLASESVTAERASIRIEVEDTGIGIAQEAQERIFERFAQVDESTTRRYGGSGLGLSIARHLAQMMGGSLTVSSAPGAGSCFTLRVGFLCQPAAADRPLHGRVVLLGPRVATAGYWHRLRGWGIEAVAAVDLAQARELLEQGQRHRVVLAVGSQHPDAAFCDADLAELDGAEPLDLILVGRPAGPTRPRCLTALPAEVSDEALYQTLRAALATPEASADAALTTSWRAGASRRILVAEDNRTNQNVIERMLRSVGHQVTIVDNGEQALEALEESTFDLVLMDLNMPVMGGLDAIKLHRFAAGSGAVPRIVALTADASDETRRQSAAAGIDAYVTKPVEVNELLGLVDRLTRTAATAPVPAKASAVVVPHPRLANAAPVLDPSRLERLRQLDDDDGFVASVIGDFIEDAGELVREIARAAHGGDAEAFRDGAHALRSSAAYLGATAIFDLCLAWRRITPDELAEHGARYAEKLESAFEKLRAALHGVLAEQDQRSRTINRPH